MSQWRGTAKTILATAAATSIAWLAVGAVVIQRERTLPSVAAVDGAGPGSVQAFAAGSYSPPARGLRASSSTAPGPLVVPVAGVSPARLSDTFTQARAGGERVHDAIDIMAPLGTPVVAAAPGRIEKLFLSDDGGRTAYVRSRDGTLLYYYAHLDQYAPGLAEGQVVRAGQALGTTGVSGNANPATPHLHFAVKRTSPRAKWWEPGVALNPYPLLTGR